MGASIPSLRYTVVEPLFNSRIDTARHYSDEIFNPNSTHAKAYSFSVNVLNTCAAVPLELLAAIENAIKLPFIAVTAVFWDLPLSVLGFTGYVLCIPTMGEFFTFTLRENVPGFGDLFFTAYKVVMFVVGACLTLSVGMFSTTANEDIHRALGLLSPRIDISSLMEEVQSMLDEMPSDPIFEANLEPQENPLADELAELKVQLEKAEKQHEEDVAQQQKYLQHVSEANEKVKTVEKEKEIADQQVKDAEVKRTELDGKITELERKNKEWQDQYKKLEETSTASLKEAHEKIDVLTKSSADWESLYRQTLTNLTTEQQARVGAEEKLKQVVAQAAAAEEVFRKNIEDLAKEKSKAEAEKDAAELERTKIIDDMNKERSRLAGKIEYAETQLKEKIKIIEENEKTRSRLEDLVRTSEKEMKQAQRELEALKLLQTPVKKESEPVVSFETLTPKHPTVVIPKATPDPLKVDTKTATSARKKGDKARALLSD